MRRAGSWMTRSPALLITVFVLVHAWLVFANVVVHPRDMYDVTTVYRRWMEHGIATGQWVGLQLPWVYPSVALLPMVLAAVGGVTGYGEKWLAMVCVLDLVALLVLIRARGRGIGAGWIWTLFLLVFGPIALARIDSITIPLAIVAVVLLARRPVVAGVLLTIAAWIKVWPVAVLVAAVVALRSRLRILLAAVATSAAVVAAVVVVGHASIIAGFLSAQTGRGLQIEAPVSGFWLWQAVAKNGPAHIFFDRSLITWQVTGPGAQLASSLMTPLLALVVLVVVILGIRALRLGADAALLPALAFALVAALILFNKVGSPQYYGWLVVPVILAVLSGGVSGAVRLCVALTLVIAGLTQLVFPWFYGGILALHPAMIGVLTLRNLLLAVLFVAALVSLARVRVAAAPRLNG